jgi:hypothetical protein
MSMKRALPIVMVGAALMLGSQTTLAHHAVVAEFNVDKPVTLRGTLTKMEWVNPHGWIYLDVKDPDGVVENWAIETGSPYRMEKRGLNKRDFRAGSELIVGGFASKDGSRVIAGWVVTFPDRESSFPKLEATFPLGR